MRQECEATARCRSARQGRKEGAQGIRVRQVREAGARQKREAKALAEAWGKRLRHGREAEICSSMMTGTQYAFLYTQRCYDEHLLSADT